MLIGQGNRFKSGMRVAKVVSKPDGSRKLILGEITSVERGVAYLSGSRVGYDAVAGRCLEHLPDRTVEITPLLLGS